MNQELHDTKTRSPKRQLHAFVLEREWKEVFALSLTEPQRWFLTQLWNQGNYGLIPNVYEGNHKPITSYQTLEQINRKLKRAGLPLRLRQIGRGGSFGDKPFRLSYIGIHKRHRVTS